ncbi:hypothetical protein CVT25_006877 [Psilocybe cyanescens]|uniref:Uncharacterized protein n=1 Tax=Psilocybe cyanescens TaxID=93625 RepID=A0A409XH23_PSICY|nr:hypothetical protein CVT25_006877 [Psilocybe cyanescens]
MSPYEEYHAECCEYTGMTKTLQAPFTIALYSRGRYYISPHTYQQGLTAPMALPDDLPLHTSHPGSSRETLNAKN